MTYPGLSNKIVKTLIVGLIDNKKTRATHEGAIRGLMAIGKEAVRQGLVNRSGARVVGEKCMPGESSQLVDLVMVRLAAHMSAYTRSLRSLSCTIGGLQNDSPPIRPPGPS